MRTAWLAAIAVAWAATAVNARPAKPGSTVHDCDACGVLVVVPSGQFQMGADGGEPGRPEGPVRTVSIASAFAVGRTEVTNRAYAAFVEATGHASSAQCRTWIDGAWTTATGYDWRRPEPGRAPAPDEPVVCVSWRDATAFTQWLTTTTGKPYRLLSEAEWEYVAREGGKTSPSADCAYANMYDRAAQRTFKFAWEPAPCDDGHASVSPVGALKPNRFGLYDVLGNVWEWTEDCYVAPYPATPVDGSAVEATGACERRTVRGGSYITRPDRFRPSFRGRDPEDATYAYFGFRIARRLEAGDVR